MQKVTVSYLPANVVSKSVAPEFVEACRAGGVSAGIESFITVDPRLSGPLWPK